MSQQTISRSERLKSRKSITSLFETGKSLSVPPIRMIYQFASPEEKLAVKIGFAVPKKNFKRAVDRNLLKRRMREAYRLNKQILIKNESGTYPGVEIMLIFHGLRIEEFDKISLSIKDLLKKLSVKGNKPSV
jgi:ribonuclease P protein component